MRMNKKNHAAGAKKAAAGKKERSAKNDFRKNPFVNRKDDFEDPSCHGKQADQMNREDAKHMAELIGSMLEEVFGGDPEGCTGPVIGVIELDPDCMLNLEFGGPAAKHEEAKEETSSAMPPADGCGEEVFQEMLGDLNHMAKMILEADFLTKMIMEEKVDPEDARCITYLSVHEARNILNKWDAYRRCEI